MARKKSRTTTKEAQPTAQDNGQAVPSAAPDAAAQAAAPLATTAPVPETVQPATEPAPLPPILAEKAAGEAAPATSQQASHAYVQAPPKGRAGALTIDNRLGYRKETVERGSKRQIRFADREGGQRPDDELLAPLREAKPIVEYQPLERAWRAQNDAEGRHALDLADQRLRDISHKRRQGPER